MARRRSHHDGDLAPVQQLNLAWVAAILRDSLASAMTPRPAESRRVPGPVTGEQQKQDSTIVL